MIFQRHSYFSLIRGAISCLSLAVTVGTLSACGSLHSWFKQADSPLPLETANNGSGKVTGIRAFETSDRLYVSGSAARNRLSGPAHVDVQLIGANGIVIDEKLDAISPIRSNPPRSNRDSDSYVASFPLEEARRARKVRVVYHGGSHAKIPGTPPR